MAVGALFWRAAGTIMGTVPPHDSCPHAEASRAAHALKSAAPRNPGGLPAPHPPAPVHALQSGAGRGQIRPGTLPATRHNRDPRVDRRRAHSMRTPPVRPRPRIWRRRTWGRARVPGIHAAASQEVRRELAGRQPHQVCDGVARAIWPGDHGVFRFEEQLTIRANEQGAERLVATLARVPGERDSGPEMLEIRIGHVSTITSPRTAPTSTPHPNLTASAG